MGALQFGELFGRSFSYLFKRGGLLLAISFLFLLPVLGVEVFFPAPKIDPSMSPSQIFEFAGEISIRRLIEMIFSLLVSACVTYGVLQLARDGELTVGLMVRKGLSRLGRVFLAQLWLGLYALLWIVPAVVLMLLTGPLAILVVVGLLAVLVYLTTTYAPLLPVVVAEDIPIMESLRRCRELTDGNKGTILGTWVLLFLISVVGGAVLGVVIGPIAAGGLAVKGDEPLLLFSVQLFGVATTALMSIFSALVYHDLRTAKEGLGSEDVAKIFD